MNRCHYLLEHDVIIPLYPNELSLTAKLKVLLIEFRAEQLRKTMTDVGHKLVAFSMKYLHIKYYVFIKYIRLFVSICATY